ncbi:hypothetical protein DN069_16210 [Streptacidiphilus pinicola]|uniref:Uncharacterized protein n=1 Tax=Streptacidiphilus pinicola TaxID=2219663 RepID=A0A2X0JAN5_9ACTN|nr:hypothetical protein [Streptacidiphilus pinicola]RAG84588.1 hypothetical protein DN069_16210 [Streptacidiphilus pinicola]
MAADDLVALAEIEMYSDLIIAAAATPGERLTEERIDTILRVERDPKMPRVPQQRVSDEDPPPTLGV